MTDAIQRDYKELDYYFQSLFKQANRFDIMRRGLMAMTIFCLMCSIIAKGYFLYILAVSVLLLQILSWCSKIKSNNIRYLGNEFQKLSMLYRAYNQIPSEFQLSHLKALVTKWISNDVEKKKETNAPRAEYNLSRSENPKEILISMIHENSYWNHHLYRSVFIIFVSTVSTIIFGLIIVSLLFLPLITIDPDYTVPRLAFSFLSFTLIYEWLEKAVNSYS
ncbi:hypothetical protein L0152_26130, partial [bacterium]|nr:hypothetical protein [bacterium]